MYTLLINFSLFFIFKLSFQYVSKACKKTKCLQLCKTVSTQILYNHATFRHYMPSETCFDSETLLDDDNFQIDSYSLCREHISNALQTPCQVPWRPSNFAPGIKIKFKDFSGEIYKKN